MQLTEHEPMARGLRFSIGKQSTGGRESNPRENSSQGRPLFSGCSVLPLVALFVALIQNSQWQFASLGNTLRAMTRPDIGENNPAQEISAEILENSQGFLRRSAKLISESPATFAKKTSCKQG